MKLQTKSSFVYEETQAGLALVEEMRRLLGTGPARPDLSRPVAGPGPADRPRRPLVEVMSSTDFSSEAESESAAVAAPPPPPPAAAAAVRGGGPPATAGAAPPSAEAPPAAWARLPSVVTWVSRC
jgi:hypothetical protein